MSINTKEQKRQMKKLNLKSGQEKKRQEKLNAKHRKCKLKLHKKDKKQSCDHQNLLLKIVDFR